MMPLLEGLSLEEKQRLYYNGSHCVYCGEETVYVDSIEVYRESYGFIYLCRPCQAWVNTHNQSQDHSFGFVAKKGLRDLRHQAHEAFDPLWQAKVTQLGTKKKQAQSEARNWLANYLNIDISECHIGMFDEDLCRKTIEKCKSFYPTEEQVKKRAADLHYRIDTVNSLSNTLGFEVKEFYINGFAQMELRHPNGKLFYYDPKKRIGRWKKNKKPSPIEDIEEFIIKNFQPI